MPPAIYLELERMGFKVWYDNRADDLTKEGMLKGIEQAAAFVLFLSTGVLERPYCQMEIRHALALKKPIVLLHGETKQRAHNDHFDQPINLYRERRALRRHRQPRSTRRGASRLAAAARRGGEPAQSDTAKVGDLRRARIAAGGAAAH